MAGGASQAAVQEDATAGTKEAEASMQPDAGLKYYMGWGTAAAVCLLVVLLGAGTLLHFRGAAEKTQGQAAAVNAPKGGGALAFEQLTGPTRISDKPASDKRLYQFFTLPNGLQVVNVQDTSTTQTAFSVAVDAGSLDNPKNLPGLAHFCEHMLFLGTTKYPDAAGFDEFVAKAGGYNNAYTSDEKTVYYSEVSASSVEEGLDRFADFFRSPLFDATYVGKEVNAIDSEHAKNVQDPSHRTFEVIGHLANPDNPSSWFKTGTSETLFTGPKEKGVNVVEELKKWNKANYCPPRMRLVTLGPMTLEAQKELTSRLYADIPAGTEECRQPRKSWAEPPVWPPAQMGRFVGIEGNSPSQEIWMHFPMPDLRAYKKSAPTTYLSHIFEFGGEKSLSWKLRDGLGYVNSFGVSFDGSSAGYNCFIVAGLTPKGREHYLELMDVIFAYVLQAQEKGVDTELQTSLADLLKLQWNWDEVATGADLVMDLSARFIGTEAKDLLSVGRMDLPNTTLVADLLSRIRPDNMNVFMVDPKANTTIFSGMKVEVLEHYGVRYASSGLTETLPEDYKRWSSWFAAGGAASSRKRATEILKGPLPGEPEAIKGIPKELNTDHMHASLASVGGNLAKNPNSKAGLFAKMYGADPVELLEETATTKLKPQLWYRSGWQTESPKVSMVFSFVVPRKADSFEVPLNETLRLAIYSHLLSETMSPKLYDLSLLGVSQSISLNPHSIEFSFVGFEPLIPQLMDKVLDEFDKGVGSNDTTRYNRIVQEMKESLTTYSEMPINYAIEDRNMLIAQSAYTREEKLAVLNGLNVSLAASAVDELLLPRSMQISALAMGNLDQVATEAAYGKIRSRAQKWKGASAIPAEGEEVRHTSPVIKPGKSVEVRTRNKRAGDGNHATVVSFLVGVMTVESRVLYGILTGILHNVAYSELRTNRQLGYVVNGGISPMSNVHYTSVVVQGDVLDSDAVEAAIEYVYSIGVPSSLKNMTSDEFKAHVASFEEQLLMPPAKFQEEFGHFWSPISMGGQCVDLKGEMLAYLRESVKSKEQLVAAWNEIAYPKEGRLKLLVKHFGGEVPPRPSLTNQQAAWRKEGLPESSIERLSVEYGNTDVYDKVDSQTRHSIAATGSLYPTDLHCTRAAKTAGLLERSAKKQRRAKWAFLRSDK